MMRLKQIQKNVDPITHSTTHCIVNAFADRIGCFVISRIATMHTVTLFVVLYVTYHCARTVDVSKKPPRKSPYRLKASAVADTDMKNDTFFREIQPPKGGFGKLGDRIPKGKHFKVNGSDPAIAEMLDPPIQDYIEHYRRFYFGHEDEFDVHDEFLRNPIVKHVCDRNDVTSFRKIVKNGKVTLNPCYPAASRKAARVKPLRGNDRFYSGYIVNQDYYSGVIYHKHFWFFETAENAPLIVVLKSLPFSYMLLQAALESSAEWTLKHNVLFLEYTDDGFSYRIPRDPTYDTLLNRILWIRSAMLEFFNIFDYAANDVYFVGDRHSSVTVLATAGLIDHMNRIDYGTVINVKGILCSHNVADMYDTMSYADIWFHLGLTDLYKSKLTNQLDGLVRASIMANKFETVFYNIDATVCEKYDEISSALKPSTSLSYHQYLVHLTNLTDFKRSVAHVGDAEYRTDDLVFQRNQVNAISRPTIAIMNYVLPRLLKRLKILYYNGQIDGIVTYKFTTLMLDKIEWPYAHEWYHTGRRLWHDESGQLVGYWKRRDNLSHILIRNAGHSLESIQPKVFQDMVTFFVEDRLPLSTV